MITNPCHEDFKSDEPRKDPRRFKKEISLDHELYVHEINKALRQGLEGGYNQGLTAVIKYLQSGKKFIEIANKTEPNVLWEWVLNALERKDEWHEFQQSLMPTSKESQPTPYQETQPESCIEEQARAVEDALKR